MKSIRSAIALFVAVAMLSLVGCSSSPQTEPAPVEQPATEQPPAEAPPTSAAPEAPADMEDVTELKIEDVTVGDGAEAEAGKTVAVHYTGWLTDGTKFDSSLDSGQPFSFGLGQSLVIPGWDEGVAGMKVGGTRILRIPPDMAYGEEGRPGAIPPSATLVFQVELLGVE